MAYELLLTEDVDALGRKGQIIKARPGYARNFLLPKKLAVIASPHALRLQKKLQEEREIQAKVDRKDAEEIAAKLTAAAFSITVKVDQEGHMYGSVTTLDIVELLKKEGVSVERKNVALKAPIKTIGLHQIPLKLKEGVLCTIPLTIEPEGEYLKKAQAAATPAPAAE